VVERRIRTIRRRRRRRRGGGGGGGVEEAHDWRRGDGSCR